MFVLLRTPTPTILRTNQREQRGSAELFARLLERHAEGHALFHPREVGAIADCGYIENGMFTKLFNACDPPSGIDQFGSLEGLCEEDLRDNSRHLLQSSRTRTVSFKASITDSCLPADTHPVEITPEITRSSDDFAFLAFAGSARIFETLTIPARTRLRSWFIRNSVRILDTFSMPAMQLIYKTVKSAGWVGGVAHCQSTTTTGRITGRISHLLRANVSLENARGIDTGMIDTRGPPRGTTWSYDAPRSYTIVVKCFQITLTDKWLYKLGLRVPAAAHALPEVSTGRIGVKQDGATADSPNSSSASEQGGDSVAQGVFAGTDDLGPDRTILSQIMEKVGRDVQDDEAIVVASSEIIHAYMEDYEADPDPRTVRYDVERLPISDGLFALHVVRLYLPDRVASLETATDKAIGSYRHAYPQLPSLRDVFPEQSFGHPRPGAYLHPSAASHHRTPSAQARPGQQHPQHGYAPRPAQAPAHPSAAPRLPSAHAGRASTPAPVLYQVMDGGNNGLQPLETATDRPIGIYRHGERETNEANARPKTHICHECGLAFDRPSALQTHTRSHTRELPYQCTECGKDFSTTTNLFRHIRSLHPHITVDAGRSGTPGRR